ARRTRCSAPRRPPAAVHTAATCMGMITRGLGPPRRRQRTNAASGARSAAPAGRCNVTPGFVSALLRAPSLRLVARIAFACAFGWGALTKLIDFPGAIAEAQHFGLEPAALVVVATIIVQLGGSLLLIFDRWAWLAAGALGVFTLFATLIAHDFWNVADAVE